MNASWYCAAVLLATAAASCSEFPGPNPGSPKALEKDGGLTLDSNVMSVSWAVKDGRLVPVAVQNKLSTQIHSTLAPVLFRFKLVETGGAIRDVTSADMEVVKAPAIENVKGDAKAIKAGERFEGQAITETLRDAKSGLTVEWRAEMREGANYVRSIVKVSGGVTTVELKRVELIAMQEKKGAKIGGVSGVPIVVGQTFFAIEVPFGSCAIGPDDFLSWFDCSLPLSEGTSHTFSMVTGVVPEGQLRRGFLYYLERERARPYKPFLHYNCWFDLGYGISEKAILANIKAFTEEMTAKRGVAMDGYVLDDGWDDFHGGFWTIDSKKFPNGFETIAAELDRVNSHLGIWISPLAGYARSNERIANARKLGLVSGDALNLAEPKYYEWFRGYCANLVTKSKMSYFKWDKAGGGVTPHFMALLRCAGELRKINPDLYFNVTVGTWPSPFWLHVIDCTWRDGGDMGYAGKGDDREKWINYRDWKTYANVVKGCRLYPLNSIMTHGIVVAPEGLANRASKAGNNLIHEARSYFGSGTALQELYIKPTMMSPKSWDALAAAAKWARQNADVLVDSHWIGGNPAQSNVYGWASWTPKKGIITLRNPDDQAQEYSLDVGEAFELPVGAQKKFALTSPYPDQRIPKVDATAGTPSAIKLEPFEVLVFDAHPE